MLLAICLLMVGTVAYIAIPADVRTMLAENCRGSSGRLKWRYCYVEMRAVGQFYFGVFFFAIVLAAFSALLLILVDEYLIPLELLHSAVTVADLNPEVWKENLTASASELSKQHENWYVAIGGSPQDVTDFQRFLWYAFPIALLLSFAGSVLCMKLTAKGYQAALDQLINDCVLRDRQRITERYLRDSRQYDIEPD